MVRKILVVVDDRPVTQSAIDHAIEVAQVHRADIFFYCVLPRYDYPVSDMLAVVYVTAETFQAEAAKEAARLLAAASAWAERCGVLSHQGTSTAADAAQAVADAAAKRHCDLIVVGTDEQNAVVRLLSGSIVPGLISKATVPVLVCKDRSLVANRGSGLRRPFEHRSPKRESGTPDEPELDD
ncbi:MAG: hypothetical protein RIS90_1579 [Pseudomonadota bacterium]|jgi:nucleotide-binding universal stress UspA family protein